MVLLGAKGQVEPRFDLFGERVNLSTTEVNTLHQWAHPTVLLGDVSQVETHFGPFGYSVILKPR
jgi:hypothetical protein